MLRRQQLRAASTLLWTVGLAALFCWPLLTRLGVPGIWDWDEAAAHYESARYTLLYYHQFPLWNPYLCGGVPALANPQSYYLSPVWIFALLFGSVAGPKIATVVYLVLGLVGVVVVAQKYGASRLASLVAAPVFLLSGFMAIHLAGGQFLWLTMVWLPWIVWSFLKSRDNWRWLTLGALLLAMTGWAGRSYLVAYEALLLLVYAVVADALGRGSHKYTGRAVVLLVLAFCLGAWKFIPDLLFLREFQQSLGQGFNDPALLWKASQLINPDLSIRANIEAVPLIEFGWYVGVVPLFFALYGLAWFGWRKKYRPLATVAWLFLFLALAPTRLNILEYVPVARELRNPQRMISIVLLALSIFMALGLDRFILFMRLRSLALRRLVLGAVGLFVVVDFLLVSTPVLTSAYSVYYSSLTPQLPEARFPFRQSDGLRPFSTVRQNEGASQFCPAALQAWQPVENGIARTYVEPYRSEKYRGEIYTLGGGAVSSYVFSPNRLSFTISTAVPDVVVLNQNWSTGWAASTGQAEPNSDRLLSVRVPPGEHQIILSYYPPGLKVGLLISAATAVVLIVWLLTQETWGRIPLRTT